MMKKRFLSLLCVLTLCLGLLPATALAVGEDAPATLYVGNTQVISSTETTYWKTNASGELERVVGASDTSNNWNVKYDPNSNTLTLRGASIQGGSNAVSAPYGSGIYALSHSGQPVSLTIKLIGENTITGSYGIYVNSELSANSYGTDASLTITGESNGSLKVSGSSLGICVKSGTGDASLTIKNASVDAKTTQTNSGYAGVYVQSSPYATSSPQLSLAVNGGSLTASGGTRSDGILFNVESSQATGATTRLTISDNAIVRAENGIKASRVDEPTPSGTGIVFNDKKGTVYGDVTLDESLTIAQGETLTIPEGSTLNTNNKLTNNGTIVNTGGTLNGEPGGIIVTAPAITTESLPDGTVGQSYTATLEATGNNITWSASDLPAGLTLDADTGAITGIPTTDGQFQVTVTATNSVGSIDRTYTLNIKPATVSVTGLKLDKDSLILQENGSYTLTATVEPADATNKAVTWASSDTNIATVSADGTVTAISAGNATITATAADGSGISASCNLTVTHGNMIQTPKKDVTCTVDGTEEYWTCEICGKHYKDESGTIPTTPEEKKIQATGHNYENGKCTVCSEVDPAFKAMIIKGANGEWRKGSEDGLFFTSNAAFADFLKVQVDGKDVDSSKYTVEEGSTIVTLNASYLETLSAGKHTLAIVSDTGTAETEFTVVAAEKQVVDDESANDKADNDGDKESLAKTGDDSMLPITALSILAVVSIATGVFALRRSRI